MNEDCLIEKSCNFSLCVESFCKITFKLIFLATTVMYICAHCTVCKRDKDKEDHVGLRTSSTLICDVRYFPKGIFPSGNIPKVFLKWQLPKCAISQGATSQVCLIRSAWPLACSRRGPQPLISFSTPLLQPAAP